MLTVGLADANTGVGAAETGLVIIDGAGVTVIGPAEILRCTAWLVGFADAVCWPAVLAIGLANGLPSGQRFSTQNYRSITWTVMTLRPEGFALRTM